jgi:hypothetical protein
VPLIQWSELKLVHKVVVELSKDIQMKGHVLSMDNFFISIELLRHLELTNIYATCIVRSNMIGLPLALKNRKFSRICLEAR